MRNGTNDHLTSLGNLNNIPNSLLSRIVNNYDKLRRKSVTNEVLFINLTPYFGYFLYLDYILDYYRLYPNKYIPKNINSEQFKYELNILNIEIEHSNISNNFDQNNDKKPYQNICKSIQFLSIIISISFLLLSTCNIVNVNELYPNKNYNGIGIINQLSNSVYILTIIKEIEWIDFLQFKEHLFNYFDFCFCTTPLCTYIIRSITPISSYWIYFSHFTVFLRSLRIILYFNDLKVFCKLIIRYWSNLMVTVLYIIVGTLVFGNILHAIEGNNDYKNMNNYNCSQLGTSGFDSTLNSMWFVITTITTVGYGDIVPVTISGKIVTSVVLFLGIIFLMAIPSTIIMNNYQSLRRFKQKKPSYIYNEWKSKIFMRLNEHYV